MGGAKMVHFNNINKSKFWYQPSQSTTLTQSGTYTLESTYPNTLGTKILRIKRPFAFGTDYYSNGYYVLEYRTSEGFDTELPTVAKNAVSIRLVDDGYVSNIRKTFLVKALPLGTSYVDAEAGITIEAASASAAGAVINVTMQTVIQPCVRNTPQVSIFPAGQWGTAGGSLNYTLSIKNIDSETCGVSNFTVTPTLPAGFTQSPNSLAANLVPGEEKLLTFSVGAASEILPATYTFTEVVQNSASATGTASASANYNIAPSDATEPTVAITSPVNGTKLKGSKVQFSANASDISGIARIELSIDGAVVKTCSAATTCAYSWTLRKVTTGSHTLRAVATDNSTLQNSAENTITVTK
jgi:uncharacterized repeat protein (TIGR01451 family)